MELEKLKGYNASRMAFWLMNQQAYSGIQFDVDKARALLAVAEQMMNEIENEVKPQLPPRELNKTEQKDWTIPAKPFKKDGTPSQSLLNFVEKHTPKLRLTQDAAGKWYICCDEFDWCISVQSKYEIDILVPMDLGNQSHLKDWLLTLGWKPTLWNYKKNDKGKPERDERGNLIKTSPKLQENGKLCSNLERMDIPLVAQVVKWLSVRNRRAVIEGWLSNERINFDGRLSAGSSGIANTHRQRHTTVVNLPKADPSVTLGYEMRDLFVPRKGRKLVGFDASGLESRVEGHYTYKYDGGVYARELLEGDIHTKNAFVFYAEELAAAGISFDKADKDDPKFKRYRNPSKNGKYALSYGASPKKLASTLGLPEARGEELYEAFWSNNTALNQLRVNVEKYWENVGEKKWIVGIDGRRVGTRSRHSLINALFQSCGAIIMDYSSFFMNRWLGGITYDLDGYPCYKYNGTYVYRVGYMHDEFVYDCEDSVAEEIAEMGVRSIIEAGKYLKLCVPLDAEAKIGNSWAEIH